MKVLVAFATKHGSTAGIAEKIAEVLSLNGHPAEAIAVDHVQDLEEYDAVLLGGAAYMSHWLKPMVRFAHHHRTELAARPVWLFSSGPLGTEQVDEQGQGVQHAARPKEFRELTELLSPRGDRVFFGAYDPEQKPIGLVERVVQHLPAAPALPTGDFRDWNDIEEWARQVAAELSA